MLDGLVILLALARQLPEDEFRTRIARIHPKFELHFLPGLLAGGRIRWLGEQEAPQAEVDARQVRIARKHRSILLSRFVPLALRFQRFGVQLVDLVRLRMVVEERLRGSQREIRVGVNREIQNRRIIREVTRERLEPCRRLTGLIRSERTPNACGTYPLPQVRVVRQVVSGFGARGDPRAVSRLQPSRSRGSGQEPHNMDESRQ